MIHRKPKRYEDLDQLDIMLSSADEETQNYILNKQNNPNQVILENYKHKINMKNKKGIK